MTTQSIRAARRGSKSAVQHGRLLLFGLSLGYFMVLLDTTIVVVALPAIGQSLGGDVNQLQWVSNGYTLTFAALLLTAGALADRFGGRRIFLIGLWAFAVISALSAAAWSMGLLIAARAFWRRRRGAAAKLNGDHRPCVYRSRAAGQGFGILGSYHWRRAGRRSCRWWRTD
ncbi:MAG: MFS transporter [Mycobacteriales bacterium]